MDPPPCRGSRRTWYRRVSAGGKLFSCVYILLGISVVMGAITPLFEALLEQIHHRLIAPLADRLVLFHSELAHEVAVTRMPRISLTVWGFGHATRRAPPPSTLDLAPRCTSDHCQKAQRRREAEAFAAGLRIGAVKNIA